jgi:hypothetical protein
LLAVAGCLVEFNDLKVPGFNELVEPPLEIVKRDLLGNVQVKHAGRTRPHRPQDVCDSRHCLSFPCSLPAPAELARPVAPHDHDRT